MNPPDMPPPKKGLSCVALAGLGCGGLLVVLLVAGVAFYFTFRTEFQEFGENPQKAMAMLVIKANPNLEVISTDDVKQEITVRMKDTSEQSTVSFGELAKGKLHMKGPNGETVMGGDPAATAPPEWVLRYPTAEVQFGGTKTTNADSISGVSTSHTPDGSATVRAFFENRLKEGGFQPQTTTEKIVWKEQIIITGKKDEGRRTITVMITPDQRGSTIMTSYQGPKE